ncbi:MAG: hypothetical protein HY791_24530 [Deltaproteobacteria bacterium]|nr:hypothetical protein [Deltaproteobacteria bacterium]
MSTVAPEQIIEEARSAAFAEEDPASALEHFRPLAEAVNTEELPIFTGQPLVMLANVRAALKAIEPHLANAVRRLVDPHLQEVFELPSLTLALNLAVSRVPAAKLSPGDIESMLSEGADSRALTLSFLEIASHPKLALVPAERVRAIRQGSGKLDRAEDFVAIAHLFGEHKAALAGKHPFPDEMITRMGELGASLLGQIKPSTAVRPAPQRSPESILRDQLAQLVVDRYDNLEVLTVVAIGKRQATELLPALRSFAAARTKNAPTEPV